MRGPFLLVYNMPQSKGGCHGGRVVLETRNACGAIGMRNILDCQNSRVVGREHSKEVSLDSQSITAIGEYDCTGVKMSFTSKDDMGRDKDKNSRDSQVNNERTGVGQNSENMLLHNPSKFINSNSIARISVLESGIHRRNTSLLAQGVVPHISDMVEPSVTLARVGETLRTGERLGNIDKVCTSVGSSSNQLIAEQLALQGSSSSLEIHDQFLKPSGWWPPPAGVLKINVDTSFLESTNENGTGLVIRDFAGQCRGIRGTYKHGVVNAEQGECLTVREALWWAKEQSLQEIIIEADAKVVIESIIGEDSQVVWGNRNIIKEIKMLALNFNMCQFRYARRGYNQVADVISKAVGESFWDIELYSDFSDFVMDKLDVDQTTS